MSPRLQNCARSRTHMFMCVIICDFLAFKITNPRSDTHSPQQCGAVDVSDAKALMPLRPTLGAAARSVESTRHARDGVVDGAASGLAVRRHARRLRIRVAAETAREGELAAKLAVGR